MRSLLSCLAFLTFHNESNVAFLFQWLIMGSKRAVVEYRKSVDLSFEDASKALDKLPPTVFTQGRTFYPNRNFKNAPTWAKGIKLIPLTKSLLEATHGANVHQKSFLGHMKVWGADAEINHDTMDDVIYGIRAFVSQLLNHKAKENRETPRAYEAKYGCLRNMLGTPQAGSHSPKRATTPPVLKPAPDDDSEVEITQVKPVPEPEIVDLDFDLEEYKKQIFHSDDPDIQKFLQEYEPAAPRFRASSKRSDVAIACKAS